MPVDYREFFYQNYVSKFKTDQMTRPVSRNRPWHDWCRKKYLPLLQGLPRTARILDVGCGHGPMLSFLRECGFTDLIGIDTSEEQVSLCRADGLPAVVADVFEYFQTVGDEELDAIVAVDFIEHFEKGESLRLLMDFRRLLSPGGLLLIQTPNGEGLLPGRTTYGDITHSTIFTPSSLRQLLLSCGFDEFDFHETGPAAKDTKGVVRWVLWKGIRLMATLVSMIETGETRPVWTQNLICLCRKPKLR